MPVMSTTVVSLTVEVHQNQFIAGVRGPSCCATETGMHLSAVAVIAAMKGFFCLLGLFSCSSGLSRAPA